MTAGTMERAAGAGEVSEMSPTVAVVTGGIPHYRWPFFSELANRGVTLRLLAAGRLPAGILTTPSPDPRIGLTHLPAGRPGWRSDVVAELRAADPDVILLEHGSALDYAWTTLLSRRLSVPKILWTHGIARQELHGRKRGPASWGRWAQLALADGVVCYDAQMAERMAERFPTKIIGAAPNSTDGAALVAERTRCVREGRDAVRHGLGLGARFYLAGLGRLVAEKDFGSLLRVCAALRARGIDVGVVLIGDGPEGAALRGEAEALGLRAGRDVVFTGGVSRGNMLARWLFASDACVSPGPLGLAAVDCLFAGIPVLSYKASKRLHHGPEWRHLVSGRTGFFAAEHTDEALEGVCREYLERSEEGREEVRAACASYASEHLGISKMADGMTAVLRAAGARMNSL